ncbi:MAG: Dabb family protein [Acidobacteria bacterium]|nr:Dabb family protein [Acidobacteriota bacterium]
MIAHIVLFRPRRDLTAESRQALVAALEAALAGIPAIRRARVGRRLRLGRAYDALMRADYPYIAILEFDDEAALTAYLEHPAHEQLAARFYAAFEDALMYDFELAEGTAGLAALGEWSG